MPDELLNLVRLGVDGFVGNAQVVLSNEGCHVGEIWVGWLVEAMSAGEAPSVTDYDSTAEHAVNVDGDQRNHRRKLVEIRIVAVVDARLKAAMLDGLNAL